MLNLSLNSFVKISHSGKKRVVTTTNNESFSDDEALGLAPLVSASESNDDLR